MTNFSREKNVRRNNRKRANGGRKTKVCLFLPEKKTVERLSIDIIGGTSKISVDIDHSWSKNTEEVTSPRFKLIAWPRIIGSAKFVQECAGTVTGFLGIKNKEVGVTSYK